MAGRIAVVSGSDGAVFASARSPAVRFALALASLGVAAAFSSWAGSRLPVATKLAELALCVLAWEIAAAVTVGLLRRRLGPARFGASPWPLLAAIVLASLPATAAMMAVFVLVGERVASVPLVYGESLLIGLVLALARRGIVTTRPVAARSTEAAPSAVSVGSDTSAAFLARHAPALAGRLLALQAEDHYLRLHTDEGTALILMRLRDAVAELGQEAGWQPHRSWWLAHAASARAEKTGAGWRIILPSGLSVPVSRANVPAMRAAGLG